MNQITDFSPFIPSEHALNKSVLPDKALSLTVNSAKLAGLIATDTRKAIIRHMAVINSYYSNLIEGNRTRPFEIRAAQKGDFSNDPVRRDYQLESLAHIQVQRWLEDQNPSCDTLFTPDFIQKIHYKFYTHIPNSLKALKDQSGDKVSQLAPGKFRTKQVTIGEHLPPNPSEIKKLMTRFCEAYHPLKYAGHYKLIAVMCAHHRFAWIHPFADGNGRVGRLLTDAALRAIGLESYGVWCLSRGLARSSDLYKSALQLADSLRQGSLDGRGVLSERQLIDYCDFMLDTAIDQVNYISDLLQLDSLYSRLKKYVQARNDSRVPGVGKIKEVSALIIYNAFLSGKLARSTALELCAMPERSARRLLKQMREEGLLSEKNSRSPLYWEIPEHAEPWYFPQLTPEVF